MWIWHHVVCLMQQEDTKEEDRRGRSAQCLPSTHARRACPRRDCARRFRTSAASLLGWLAVDSDLVLKMWAEVCGARKSLEQLRWVSRVALVCPSRKDSELAQWLPGRTQCTARCVSGVERFRETVAILRSRGALPASIPRLASAFRQTPLAFRARISSKFCWRVCRGTAFRSAFPDPCLLPIRTRARLAATKSPPQATSVADN